MGEWSLIFRAKESDHAQNRCWWPHRHGRQAVVLWPIRAARLLGQRVTFYGKRPCSRATANVAEFAGSAFATQFVGISKLFENGRITIDFTEILFPHISARNWKKATGIDFPRM
jgi:hypothetical protein